MTKTVDEAKVLIENLAASDCNNCPDYDRSSRTTTSSPDSFQMTELKNMMAQVLKGQFKHINAIEGMSDANEDPSRECMRDFSNEANEEDVNYIGNYGNEGYNPSYRPNPNMSFRNPNVENPQYQVYPPRLITQESLLEHSGAYGTQGAWRDLAHGSSSTGYAKEEGRSHLEDQLDRLLDQPVEFLNSTGQASTRSSWKSKSNPKNVASPLTFL
ncbi:unnamed protein product [Microthlaspi erraticum]|uniref:Uncharacterized protein n=1 Tax=Microthlaspi erraticum TaxID=1685480 RepID=A0A6D2KVJ2_9BRAS|nr:unnamed protein product [Microthlaspi erraticum]